ncbi:hypothetical protein M9H77_16338 [Catharanthus roseus]|uniref:Uncharacterized protein n=1 Tax=Catharanthus roseus TaxID=4058 RepID=A0ACC0B1H1_CATRO|nr:hypothetical protein M9H77_16338 [Catharanthus roseus]
MAHSEDFVEENIVFENDVDPITFEEFFETKEYVDHEHFFATNRIFNSKVELVDCAKEIAMKVNTYLIVTRYLSSRTSNCRPYVTLGCESRGTNKPRTKPRVDDEVEEASRKSRAAKLTEEKLIQTEQFRKSHVPPLPKKIYNVAAKIKKDKMQGKIRLKKILCLSAQQGYTVFYRNCEDSNVQYATLEVVGMTPPSKNFTVATAFMRNQQATTYR